MHNTSKKIKKLALAAALLMGLSSPALAQEKLYQDTLECHIVGFSVGTMFPDRLFSKAVDPATGINNEKLTMNSMYKSPFLDFNGSVAYKYKSNWVVSADYDFWFGSDNLRDRVERLEGVYSSAGIVMAINGVDGVFQCNNRGMSIKAGLGKIIVVDKKNPNSGIWLKGSTGWCMSKTVFSQDYTEASAPQLSGIYQNLYDQRKSGWMLSEGIGYWFMSNKLNLWNCYAMFEVSQCWMRSTRDYTIDKLAGLHGKDESRHFDMLYTLKLCWMFPLKGKSSFDYYYY